MKQIFITTQKNLDRLQSMMFCDIGQYSFQKTKEGVIIELDETNPNSLEAFAKRFSTWFAKECLLDEGNRYFKGHAQEERWKIWKKDFRFMETYCDEVYQAIIQREWVLLFEEMFFDENVILIQIDLDVAISSFAPLTELRLKLIDDHFTQSLHEDYILLRLNLPDQHSSTSSM